MLFMNIGFVLRFLFLPRVPILWPIENIRKSLGFLVFSGGIKREHSGEMGLSIPAV